MNKNRELITCTYILFYLLLVKLYINKLNRRPPRDHKWTNEIQEGASWKLGEESSGLCHVQQTAHDEDQIE